MKHKTILAMGFLSLFILAISAQGAVLYSDNFANGTLGTSINGQPLNNALGGSQSVTWLSNAAVTYATHTTSTQRTAIDNWGNRSLTSYAASSATTIYTYEIKVDPLVGDAGGFGYFAGVTILNNTTNTGFWDPYGVMFRFFNNSLRTPQFDGFYGNGTSTVPLAGAALAMTDVDANGFYNVKINYIGNGTATYPLTMDVCVASTCRNSYNTITNLAGGNRVGFSAAYPGAYYDDVVFSTGTYASLPTNSALPAGCFKNVGDYTYMWWENGYRDPSQIFDIQTNKYAIRFDNDAFTLNKISPIDSPATEDNALVQDNNIFYDASRPTCYVFSDSFANGSVGTQLNTQDLNNAYGGEVLAEWDAPAGSTYVNHPVSGSRCISPAYDCSTVKYNVNHAVYHTLNVKVEPTNIASQFIGVAMHRDPNRNAFWDPAGVMFRFFWPNGGVPSMDMFYGDGTNRIWPGGATLAMSDIDANGFFPVRIGFGGEGTASSPFGASVAVNGNVRANYSNITNLSGGNRVGFAAPYGGWAEDFILEASSLSGASSITCVLENNGSRYVVTSASNNQANSQLIESGKYYQRRLNYGLNWQAGCPSLSPSTYLQVAAWPDRVSFMLNVIPNTTITNGALEVTIDVPEIYSKLITSGSAKALKRTNGSGYVFMAAETGAILNVDPSSSFATVRFPTGASWAAGVPKTATLIVYPTSTDVSGLASAANATETSPITVTASTLASPFTAQAIGVAYYKEGGYYYVSLPDTGTGNDRIERVSVTANNTNPTTRTLRFCFGKENSVYGITGISAMIRGQNLSPSGIPVQHSKDWHGWVWWHGMSMMSVPPSTSVTFEYTSVNARWGGVAAASHNQLCLVGYANNQLWDQSAIGSWGESICYDPDVNCGRSMIDDVRPLMVWAMDTNPATAWSWTNNVGGGDFLVYYAGGVKQWNSRMRTLYKKYSPCLTEVSYAGRSADSKIKLKCTVSIYRTDDIVRGIYNLRYDVTATTPFTRLAFLQVGSDGYNIDYNMLARGNEGGLIEEWAPTKGGGYSRTGIALTGDVPWISMHQTPDMDPTAGAWANRGVVLRKWSAKLNGASAAPYAAICGTVNPTSSIMELSAPPGVTQLVAGDYVDAQAIHVIVPKYLADYYGPNSRLYAALGSYQDTWQMIKREATGNNLYITMTSGTLLNKYPVKIWGGGAKGTQFTIRGGLGYIPVTICGLNSYMDPVLKKKVGGTWTTVDQSLYGNDWWQCNYDADSKKYELTFNLPLDTANDVPADAEFRLENATSVYTGVIFSDNFTSGVIGSGINGRSLNNALGGAQSVTWSSPGSTYATHPTSGQPACSSAYDCSTASYNVGTANTFRLETLTACVPTGFTGIGLNRDPARNAFWDPAGVMLRLADPTYGGGWIDWFYGDGVNRIFPGGGGNLNSATDVDSNGFYPVRVDFKGAGTGPSPFQVTVYVNGHQRLSYSGVTNISGGARVGFSAPYGGYFDNFSLKQVD